MGKSGAVERILTRVVLFLINFYQKAISPFFPPLCRYQPSCSEYGKQAIEKYGFCLGIKKTVLRILRCHPWGGSGYDPP